MDLAALLPWPELRTVVAAPADAKLRETADKIDAVRMTLHRREAEAQRREGATTTTTGGSRTQVDDVLLAGYTFVDSIRLKNWLDWLEVEGTCVLFAFLHFACLFACDIFCFEARCRSFHALVDLEL